MARRVLSIPTPCASRRILCCAARKFLSPPAHHQLRPAEFPFEHPRVHDSDEILEIGVLPKTLAVVGAGVIGAEYAGTFNALGVEVHLIDGRDSLLGFLDREISENIQRAMTAAGVHFIWKEKVTRCDAPPTGDVTLTLTSGATLAVSDVLVAAGRQSNTADLNLAAAGLTPGKRGLIKVDAQCRSEVPHIFAAGDVIGAARARRDRHGTGPHGDVCCLRVRLQGRGRADPADRHLHHSRRRAWPAKPRNRLRQKGIAYVVGRARYMDNPRGQIIGDENGLLKLIFARDDMRLLGVHVVGEQATELVHIGLVAMMSDSGRELFNRTCFNYPTLGDLYKYATYEAILKQKEMIADENK